ncbi:RagB/SusD family nutrient uptake outer membrane protein [Bacteroides stercorirosoris]|uniref:Starch-binding associating with outer membrane n=1 Tax=Bacteroides stercorirosoris TaxID=871324 RepID=A0A1M6JQQ2_9BACE|nr:RagB/SusD family nutrient uptake outer membrane protein [Bacteroides stercorirosoris]SHJ49041.1 Starch-binding associating with outer membrane [Bacteroides stercorirosoris]
MKKIIAGLFLMGASLGFTSCNDFLDMTPTNSVSDKGVWTSVTTAEYAVNYIYSYVYDVAVAQCVAGMTESLTDQMKYGSYNYNSLCFIPSEIAYGGSTLTANYVDVYLGYWGSWYTAIRRTNEGIYSLHKYGTLSQEDATRLEAEMRFVRGYLYFDLMKRYKEVIIYDEDITAITENKALSTEEEGWNFIEADLKYAASNLPKKENANGRANCGMAYAFLTRAMLYAERWDVVKSAAEEVEKLGYALEGNYADACMKDIKDGNKEAILQYAFDIAADVTHSFDYYYTPGGDYTMNGQSGGGYGTPTQEMVEAYEYADGSGFPDWSAWHAEGVTQTPPYEDLEPRFQATILYNGAAWKGRTIEPYIGGNDGFCIWNKEQEHKGRTTTGYYLRKLVDETHDVIAVTDSKQPNTIIRYGEVLLNKAEACYRLNDAAGANAAIKAIRDRVHLPYSNKSGDKLWAAIRQERKVELAYEGLWYWDLRRWKDAAKQYPEGLNGYQVHGLKIEKQANGDFTYTYVSVDDKDRTFPEKMYRFPLPSNELSSNALVTQYPEWK